MIIDTSLLRKKIDDYRPCNEDYEESKQYEIAINDLWFVLKCEEIAIKYEALITDRRKLNGK